MMPSEPQDFRDVANIFIGLVRLLMPLLVALSLLVFFWGLAKFIGKAGDTKSHAEGKNLMIWGLIALFVMVSYMGIISFLKRDTVGGPAGYPLLPTTTTRPSR